MMPQSTTVAETATIPLSIPTLEETIQALYQVTEKKKAMTKEHDRLRKAVIAACFGEDPVGTDRSAIHGPYRVKHYWIRKKDPAAMFRTADLVQFLQAQGFTEALTFVPQPNYAVLDRLVEEGRITPEMLEPYLTRAAEYLVVEPVERRDLP